MEHLGDSVAGRYVLVAPAHPREALRTYHAVDMVADRTVLVRFEPRYGDGRPGGSRLRTADGQRVIDGGTFGGEAYVVVDVPGPGPGRNVRLDLPLTELEAMFAAPAADRPPPGRSTRRRPRFPLRGATVAASAHVAGALFIVVLLVAAAVLATRAGEGPTGPARGGIVGGSAPAAVPAAPMAPGPGAADGPAPSGALAQP